MHAALPRHWSSPNRPSWRRIVAIVLTLLIHALLILMLLRLAPAPSRLKVPPRPISFQMIPERKITPPAHKGTENKHRSGGGASARAPQPPAPAAPRPTATPPELVPDPQLNMIILTKEQYAATDLSKIGNRHSGGGAAAGTGTGAGSGASTGNGEGPGGAELYDADWFRRPTDAQLSTYMPKGRHQNGYGLVACQTIPDHRVDNCKELGESPRGSGLARAVRQAAWQFQVLPPRINGRPVIGAWIRIRIDYVEGVPREH